ncbi:universal stress protein [Pseudorhodoferax sp. Leaf267]|uniref:universal stress protein n=1 Tax=Pseudorhodoferax sp. Leaf267 TaxID=1736316 RepID=UPI0006F53846|nr:universal stress protein [Pseudorhodoferax sp. Leaf267]KQP19993.1 universal stress protein UspA [Pseudorhodoferax sp. Leaf267]
MYQQILVPVDGSQSALNALRQAVTVAKAFGSTLFLVHVIDPYPFLGAGADYALGQADYLSAATSNANNALHAATEIVTAAGLQSDSAVVDGHAAEEGILATAKTCGADLIVMGSHGRRGIEKLLLGSVTQRVLQDARVPVLVVRGSEA